MGILSFLGLTRKQSTVHGVWLPPMKLSRPVVTPLGGRVSSVTCLVDIRYKSVRRKIVVTRATLATGSINGAAINVAASRRGEAWLADRALRHVVDRWLLTEARAAVAGDKKLREKMHRHSG